MTKKFATELRGKTVMTNDGRIIGMIETEALFVPTTRKARRVQRKRLSRLRKTLRIVAGAETRADKVAGFLGKLIGAAVK